MSVSSTLITYDSLSLQRFIHIKKIFFTKSFHFFCMDTRLARHSESIEQAIPEIRAIAAAASNSSPLKSLTKTDRTY